ncbi:MAG: hypothetical protein M1319_05915 [Chloroflexi bacterium]|nr:hypothetical protein [Chloroflexota bacterium]
MATKRLPGIWINAALALAGVGLILYITKDGAGVSPDSVSYLGGASGLLSGHGYSSPSVDGWQAITQWPPLFSLSIAAASLAGLPLDNAARWLNAVLFGGNIFLAGFLVRLYAPRPIWPSVVASSLVLVSWNLLEVHSMVWSEPLFFVLVLLTLLGLAYYLQHPNMPLLLGSAFACSLAFLDRYAAIAVFVAGAGGILYIGGVSLRRRLRDAAVFVSAGCILPLAVVVHNAGSGGAFGGGRGMALNFPTLNHVGGALGAVSRWVLPGSTPQPLRIAGLAFGLTVTALFVSIAWQHRSAAASSGERKLKAVPWLVTAFGIAYCAVVLLSYIVLDASIIPDDRTLAPFYLAMIVLAGCLAVDIQWWPGRFAGRVLAPSLGALVALVITSGVLWVLAPNHDWLFFNGEKWRGSQTIALVRSLPPGTRIYSNGPDAIYYLTGRLAVKIPNRIDQFSGLTNTGYSSAMDDMAKEMSAKGVVLVYLRLVDWRWQLPSEGDLKVSMALRAVASTDDGAIYQRGR